MKDIYSLDPRRFSLIKPQVRPQTIGSEYNIIYSLMSYETPRDLRTLVVFGRLVYLLF